MIQEEKDRTARLEKARTFGVDPYPSQGNRTHTVDNFLKTFDQIQNDSKKVLIVGRMRLIRQHGGLTFSQIQDSTGIVQLAFRRNLLGNEQYSRLLEIIDVGDFIEVHGTAFKTKKGEKTLDVSKAVLLSKSLLPLPEKWHGLSDVEIRFRKRYLDMIMNEDSKKIFLTRGKIISSIRKFLDEKGFIEVETPTLQPIYGGGFARPFVTHHNALNANFYLRISDEMYLKRLLVGGFEKVYEITKVFRNEGIDHDHNPEFTMLEAQIAFENYEYGMDIFEKIFETAAQEVIGTTQIKHDEITIELKRPWKRMTMIDSIEEVGNIKKDVWSDFDNAFNALSKIVNDKQSKELKKIKTVGELMAFAFENFVEEKLIQPTIVFDYPVEVSPLAKKKASNPKFVERFEAFALGSEIGNNYSELNDPIELEKRFINEKQRETAGFGEAHQTDFDYLEAIKHGMPPACGLGIGIDRMVMLLTGASNIKEVIIFPTLRPDEPSVE